MIVAFSTVEDIGAGYRSRTMMPQWKKAQEALGAVTCIRFGVLRVRIVIGAVPEEYLAKGFEEEGKFVVEAHLPIEEFKLLSIQAKNDLVLDTIFQSIKAAYAFFGDAAPNAVDQIREGLRAA